MWAQYSIQVENRDELRSHLTKNGIPTAVFYPTPIHLSTAYADLNYDEKSFINSETISKKIISLPMHPFLKEKEMLNICNTVNSFFA